MDPIQVGVDLAQELEFLARHRVWIWMVLAAAAVFCPWGRPPIALRGTHPLREVADAVCHISSSTLNERIRPAGKQAEIVALAETFNAMLERLEESFTRLTRFSADIAHELRTPVEQHSRRSRVDTGAGASPEEYRDILGSCLEESLRLTELVERLLSYCDRKVPVST